MGISDTSFSSKLSAVIIVAINLLALPIAIYWIHKLSQWVKDIAIKVRNPKLTFQMLWIFTGAIALNAVNLAVFLLIDNKGQYTLYYMIINDLLRYAATYSYVIRAWIMFWELNWSYATVDKIWRTHITGDDNSFYLKYNHILGSSRKISLLFMLGVYPLTIIILEVPLILTNSVNIGSRVFGLSVNVGIFCAILFLVKRLHNVSDHFRIGEELLYINLCTGVTWMIGYCIAHFIFPVEDDPIISAYFSGLFLPAGCLSGIMFGTWWVIRLMRENSKGKKGTNKFSRVSTNGFRNSLNNQDLEKASELDFNQVLNTRHGFEEFAHHLIQELSVENILFLVETKQFKGAIRKHNTAALDTPLVSETGTVRTVKPVHSSTTHRGAPNIFKSRNILNLQWVPMDATTKSMQPYEHAQYIYHKYVVTSDLQVNIASRTRRKITKFFQKYPTATDFKTYGTSHSTAHQKLFELFDIAWDEIIDLIRKDSFVRFKSKPAYSELCNHFKPAFNPKDSQPSTHKRAISDDEPSNTIDSTVDVFTAMTLHMAICLPITLEQEPITEAGTTVSTADNGNNSGNEAGKCGKIPMVMTKDYMGAIQLTEVIVEDPRVETEQEADDDELVKTATGDCITPKFQLTAVNSNSMNSDASTV